MKYLKTYEQNNLDLIKCVKSGDINKIEEIIERGGKKLAKISSKKGKINVWIKNIIVIK